MSKSTQYDGVITALITPFTETGAIDWPAYERLIDRQLEAGVSGLLTVGTTGEASTLNDEEYEQVVKKTVERAKGKAVILAGSGTNVTSKTVERTKQIEDWGVDCALVVTPYYNKPSQSGLIKHYEAIADAVSIDIMLYSVPGRTGIEISPQTAAALCHSNKNIVAIKEAGGHAERVSDLRAHCCEDFVIHCGDDGLALAFYALGASGLTSVLANYDPEICVACYNAWAAGDYQTALRLHDTLRPFAEALFIENSPAPVKAVLGMQNSVLEYVRGPLAPVSPEARKKLMEIFTVYTQNRKTILS
ncbi:4-hydroxy-tetrahydrodipicolinate synthase [uncultured Cohaesibacter sp.]|uniref:4-hydroxy-tetrahydrodipicolinate synthase n=1 Tax=uncultured Cohaesibacter sp. TaxID=1002546 RepID=UPI0029C85BFB|nr:4-hydroxy-tetrahydrodipicolinate synthase [uncultured Cohaesibacter sp.]